MGKTSFVLNLAAQLAEPRRVAVEGSSEPAQELGTGHGERRYDPVTQTVFERAGSRPNQVTSLFYDSYDALVAKGVLPTRGYDYPSPPQAFPVGFAPDPQY